MKLHIGCGLKKMLGWINTDTSHLVKPDSISEWEKLPFKSHSVDEILAVHVLEHVKDYSRALYEGWRILIPGGKLRIIVPYACIASAYRPEHKLYFSYTSFDPFKKGHNQNYYYDFHFSNVKVKFEFSKYFRWFRYIANKWPSAYENSGLSWIFPAKELHVEMIK